MLVEYAFKPHYLFMHMEYAFKLDEKESTFFMVQLLFNY